MASKTSASGNRLIANNKKAYFDYFIEEKYEAGMGLVDKRYQPDLGKAQP